ncbi:hypothetical protein J437_LFUL002214 [Ladona fulva]|uniref:Uncharacterized protein n=1 Tax=Ladona fulva TaxID=123851 RepID=A0A8K0JY00_LADFU|nr:hypothetical protein J437_LFUL002214 [Ladona fulva]
MSSSFPSTPFFCMLYLQNHQSSSSPRSTPNSSPRSTKSPPPPPSAPPPPQPPPLHPPPEPTPQQILLQAPRGTSPTPSSTPASGPPSSGRSLRNDLLVAADSVTNAMSTLVRELNSDFETEEGDEEEEGSPVAGGNSTEEDGLDDLGATASSLLWHEEMRQRYEQESMFIAELRARDLGNGIYEDKYEEFVSHRPALPPRGIRPPHSASEGASAPIPPPHSLPLRRPPLRPQEAPEEGSMAPVDGNNADWEDAMKRWTQR